MDKELLRQRLMFYNTEQEVCDMLNINVEKLLLRFDEELDEMIEITNIEEAEDE